MYTSTNIKKIKDEIQSLKVVQPINCGALTKHAVVAEWQGTIDKNSPISRFSMLAAFKATYTRSDGETKTPLVQFSYLLTPDRTNYSHSRSHGVVVAASGDSVSYKIVLSDNWWAFDPSQTTGTLKVTVYAFSLVDGELTLERVYS